VLLLLQYKSNHTSQSAIPTHHSGKNERKHTRHKPYRIVTACRVSRMRVRSLKRSVSFNDDVVTHEVPPVSDDVKSCLFYTKVDM